MHNRTPPTLFSAIKNIPARDLAIRLRPFVFANNKLPFDWVISSSADNALRQAQVDGQTNYIPSATQWNNFIRSAEDNQS